MLTSERVDAELAEFSAEAAVAFDAVGSKIDECSDSDESVDVDSSSESAADGNMSTPQSGDTHLDEPIYPGAKLTRGQSMLMVMAHSLRRDSS
ncbi:hypothetical protein HPB52_020370 [Rhipicephalus sanguineus]|uniref:Uncharacterized protein n=1 Tax=Rhipicephalus sanguineus TaxID=34632 RepID=A0A9D4QC75_RHISA|nr:hypothetical protein HPB52_020370 [Rhipicephalus sanguineus]